MYLEHGVLCESFQVMCFFLFSGNLSQNWCQSVSKHTYYDDRKDQMSLRHSIQRKVGNEGQKHWNVGGRNFPGRGNGQCKGPEAGTNLQSSQSRARVVGPCRPQ